MHKSLRVFRNYQSRCLNLGAMLSRLFSDLPNSTKHLMQYL